MPITISINAPKLHQKPKQHHLLARFFSFLMAAWMMSLPAAAALDSEFPIL